MGKHKNNNVNIVSNIDLLEVAKGNIKDHRLVHKFGINRDIGTSTEDIWSYSGSYTWPTTTQHYISSSNDTDTQIIEIQGLDENWLLKTENHTLVGQTKTDIGDWSRIFRMKNMGSSDLAGNVYAYEDTTVAGGIPQTATKITAYIELGPNINQTLMAIYTIPSDETGYIIKFSGSITNRANVYASGKILNRSFGGVFRIQDNWAVSSGNPVCEREYKASIICNAKSDIIIASTASASAEISANFAILCVKN